MHRSVAAVLWSPTTQHWPAAAAKCVVGLGLRQYTSTTAEDIWIKRRPLPTTTSIKYAIPEDPYLLAQKFQQVAHSGKLDDAVAIVMQTKTRHQSPVVWNLVISEYAKAGRLSRALRGFTEMRKRGFKPTHTTFTALLKACALSDSDKSTQMAEHLYNSIADFGIEPSIINFNSLLSVYQRKHNIEQLLDRFNGLPRDGPTAPSLATYTILFSACRREIQRQLAELEAVAAASKSSQERRSFGDSRRIALIKTNIHSMFNALIQSWHVYAADAARRITEPAVDTQPLELDAHMVKIVLKACHAVYGENRALGRKGLGIVEQVYGLDKGLGGQAAEKLPRNEPLALLLRQSRPDKGAGPAPPVLDDEVVDLVFGLCKRDRQSTKALRFWKSLEQHFAAELASLKQQQQHHQPALDEFRARTTHSKS